MTVEEQLDVLQYEFMPLWIELQLLHKFYGYSKIEINCNLGTTYEEQSLKRHQFLQVRTLTISALAEIKFIQND